MEGGQGVDQQVKKTRNDSVIYDSVIYDSVAKEKKKEKKGGRFATKTSFLRVNVYNEERSDDTISFFASLLASISWFKVSSSKVVVPVNAIIYVLICPLSTTCF